MSKISIDNSEERKNILASYFNEKGCAPNEISREYSWKLCHDAFGRFINKEELSDDEVDYLALHLGFYLASWGMYRSSSFVFNYSYKIHEGAIKIIKGHAELYGLQLCDIDGPRIKEIIKLKGELKEHYSQYKYNIIKDSDSDKTDEKRVISETLLSKILLGTLACAPAYDEFLKEGLKKANISPLSISEKSLEILVEENLKNIPVLREYVMELGYTGYPDMKILDMFYWELGHDDWKVL